MKRFKLLLLTLTISVSTVIYAEKSGRIYDLTALSAEIELLLRDSNHLLGEGESVNLFFSISEENTIQYVSVAATDSDISEFLEKELQHQKLDGEKWREGMIYELVIEGKKPFAACIIAHQ